MDENIIYFYDKASERVREDSIYLNNYFESPFTIGGKEYQTVEHFYQANKYPDHDTYEMIRNCETPDQAKKLANSMQYDRENWQERKDEVMMRALWAKFLQHPELKEKLLETGDKVLIEDSNKDAYWGGALEGSRNRLGEMLMEIRVKLRSD
ncbi:unnamed protein product [Blepharisma stoltei]|uniref:NADAR domain-containing protein n=1 Tax=Blepharisma stoltei TaxID=1481888 RepID=A0AAU9K135_9CILI|nr:unnamed protein product [Blepharisma stoltei]